MAHHSTHNSQKRERTESISRKLGADSTGHSVDEIKRLTEEAERLASDGQWDEHALEVNLRITELEPENVPALSRVARVYKELGNEVVAYEYYVRVLAIDPANRVARNATKERRKLEASLTRRSGELPLHVILQPCASDNAQKHFQDTIERPVPIDVLARFISEPVLAPVREHLTENTIRVWGLTPAANGSGVTKWDRMRSGDLVAFYKAKWVFFVGRLCYTARNPKLAEHLWGRDEVGKTWELIYFLDEGRRVGFPLRALTEALGYESDVVLNCRVCPATPEAVCLLDRS